MIVGTSSGAGKSLLVSALCRLAKNRGLKVAPFKAQNMSLYSFVTEEDGEIGIAQALQAMAAKISPSVHHNPILLKSEGERGMQVILHGKLYKVMKAREYYQEKNLLWRYIKHSLDELLAKYALIIMEGAGSPAEINLLDKDIVNIKPVLYTGAKVVLVGDIDRGGVFASIFGTINLLQLFLPEYSQKLLGFLVNKFRGDLAILQPGIKELEKLTNLKCLGVLPYLRERFLPEEDSLDLTTPPSSDFSWEEKLKIVIIKFPHLSMFFDFEPLFWEEDVAVFLSQNPMDVLQADVVILPGSKRTVEDLLWLKKRGYEETLKEALKRGTFVFGLCGGYQCLGERLIDEHKAESDYREIKGLSLLPMETVFTKEKLIYQVSAKVLLNNIDETLWGYEIHKGISYGDFNLFSLKRLSTGEISLEGLVKDKVWGTYLHGVFTNDRFRRFFLNLVRKEKGLPPLPPKVNFWQKLDERIELLANFIENHLEVEAILAHV